MWFISSMWMDTLSCIIYGYIPTFHPTFMFRVKQTDACPIIITFFFFFFLFFSSKFRDMFHLICMELFARCCKTCMHVSTYFLYCVLIRPALAFSATMKIWTCLCPGGYLLLHKRFLLFWSALLRWKRQFMFKYTFFVLTLTTILMWKLSM